MKRILTFIVAGLIIAAMAVPAFAADGGLLGTNHLALRVGVFAYDVPGDPLTFVRLTGQISPDNKIDVFASYMVADNDVITITSMEVGGNVIVPTQNIPATLYVGGAIALVDIEIEVGPLTASDDSIEYYVQVGIEKSLSKELAFNAKGMLDSRFDGSDLVGEGELIYSFDDNFSGLLGVGLNLSEADIYYYAGIALEF